MFSSVIWVCKWRRFEAYVLGLERVRVSLASLNWTSTSRWSLFLTSFDLLSEKLCRYSSQPFSAVSSLDRSHCLWTRAERKKGKLWLYNLAERRLSESKLLIAIRRRYMSLTGWQSVMQTTKAAAEYLEWSETIETACKRSVKSFICDEVELETVKWCK